MVIIMVYSKTYKRKYANAGSIIVGGCIKYYPDPELLTKNHRWTETMEELIVRAVNDIQSKGYSVISYKTMYDSICIVEYIV